LDSSLCIEFRLDACLIHFIGLASHSEESTGEHEGRKMTENQTQYSASEAAILLLKEYRDKRDRFRVFDNFDHAMSAMQQSVELGLAGTAEPLKTIAQRLYKISVDGFFMVQVCEYKISYLSDALVQAIESQNPVSLANNARALIEHVAALIFVMEALEKLRASLVSQGSETKVNEALGKAELILQRSYYGKSPKASEKTETAPHIESECLAALEKFVPDIREVYGYLCEFVHPNFGSNLLVSTGHLGKGRLNPLPDFHKETIDQICRYCSLTMLFLREQAIPIGSLFINLKDLVDRLLSKGAKINSVFAKRTALPEGDGMSQATAFFFPKARTALEAIQLTSSYLDESGIELTGRREVGAIIEGYVYDIYPTSIGRLWFKVPAVV